MCTHTEISGRPTETEYLLKALIYSPGWVCVVQGVVHLGDVKNVDSQALLLVLRTSMIENIF